MRSLLLTLVVLSAGCLLVPPGGYVRTTRPPPPSSPPYGAAPSSPYLSESEAVALAEQYAQSRGVRVDHVKRAHLDGDGRWHVDLRGPGKDRAKVLLDARTGHILWAKLHTGKREREHGDEDDDD